MLVLHVHAHLAHGLNGQIAARLADDFFPDQLAQAFRHDAVRKVAQIDIALHLGGDFAQRGAAHQAQSGLVQSFANDGNGLGGHAEEAFRHAFEGSFNEAGEFRVGVAFRVVAGNAPVGGGGDEGDGCSRGVDESAENGRGAFPRHGAQICHHPG